MYEKEKDLIDAFLRGQMSRRSLIRGLGALGMTTATASVLLNASATRALAQDFDWKQHQGKSLKLLLNKHPYTDAMIANLDNFKELSGMEVTYDIFPEDVYFDKVTAALSSRSSEYDAFMTGAYMTWTYGPAGWIVDHNEWIQDPTKTNPNYNWDDMLEGVRKSCAWNGVPGGALGSDDAKQWCIPWGYEQNNLTYNAEMLEKAGVDVPTSMDELITAAAQAQANSDDGVYGIGVRGSRSWATIHPGFLSAYANLGQHDLNVDNGKLSAAMNTDGSKDFHAKWVKMIQESGAADWSTHTWYQVGTDLGAGKSAMIYDADILGYFMNGGDNAMAGKLAFAPFAASGQGEPTPNIWIWSLAMSNFSKDKDAAWNFIQWASGPEHGLFGAAEMDFVNPVRQSVWDDPTFRDRLASGYPGYVNMHDVSAPGASIKFTPQPLFFDLTTEWAASLQKMVANEVPVDEGLDQLADSVNRQLKDAGLG